MNFSCILESFHNTLVFQEDSDEDGKKRKKGKKAPREGTREKKPRYYLNKIDSRLIFPNFLLIENISKSVYVLPKISRKNFLLNHNMKTVFISNFIFYFDDFFFSLFCTFIHLVPFCAQLES